GIGQRSALEAKGRSFGVLACGVDICYPKEHLGLYMDLQGHGGVLSEQPIGTPPLPFHFPARNRIISGLSDAILIIEAKESSGSLITANMALEQGKDIYALPGPVDSVLSKGCNQLIKEGAGILLSPEDLLNDLHIFCEKKMEYLKGNKIMLETTENMVYSRLCLQPKNVNQLIEEIELTIPSLMNALISLELKGLIKEITKNYYVKMK
ncbi:MAG: DNA-processing protein DprA, partial [Lachnospiraceae bacterium]